MSKQTDGGPAFPFEKYAPGCTGMSLRDYFAAHARDSDVRRWMDIYGHNGSPITEEEAKYAYADAMLHERARDQP